MNSLWNKKEAKKFQSDDLSLRVYTSRLLGLEPSLVLQGGGNTSVKAKVKNLFGETEEILYVKGSGWDLATIERQGFAPVKLDVLKRMAELESLSDSEMVKWQRAAMLDPYAPNPSVEAILHAIIPYKFVDHTHADSVVTITNTPHGQERIRAVYGDRVLIIPYVMPGFILARKVYEITKTIDWQRCEGMVLMHHGIFSFADRARESYERMIRLVTKAENYLKKNGAIIKQKKVKAKEDDLLQLAKIRQSISKVRGKAVIALWKGDAEAVSFSQLKNVSSIATRGPITPDHVIRTKRIPVILGRNPQENIQKFTKDYQSYFKRHSNGQLTMLDSAPRWAVWPGYGLISFGVNIKEVNIISDITGHTIRAIQQAEALGGWRALSEKEIFEIEYWELEQAKLKKAESDLPLQGKIAIVTGAASGIGKACVEKLYSQGAVVVACDINPNITHLFKGKGVCGLVCDVTSRDNVRSCVESTVKIFGGLDILISNAGIFPPSEEIAQLKPATWKRSLDINLTSHQLVLQACIPYLSLGIEASVVIIASKNVPAPGPAAAAYSVAKSGLTQLARVAALELAGLGIRVNVIHPNQVFDTAIWTPEVLKKRAQHYKMSTEEYKTSNLLKVEITSKDVAALACSMAGPVFAKTTGAQVPIDGGNDRVI